MIVFSRPASHVTFVIPLYFTSGGIGALMEVFRRLEAPGGFNPALVNDGSTDDPADRIKALLPDLRFASTLVDLARNSGKHNTVMQGLRQAGGQSVVTLDDDLQNLPVEALKLLAHAEATGAEVAYSCYKEKKHRWLRNMNMGSRMTNAAATFLCGFGILMVGVVLVEYLIHGPQQRGWASLMAAIAIFSGSQLLIPGLLGEYVGRAYMTLSGKPKSLIRATVRHDPDNEEGAQ